MDTALTQLLTEANLELNKGNGVQQKHRHLWLSWTALNHWDAAEALYEKVIEEIEKIKAPLSQNQKKIYSDAQLGLRNIKASETQTIITPDSHSSNAPLILIPKPMPELTPEEQASLKISAALEMFKKAKDVTDTAVKSKKKDSKKQQLITAKINYDQALNLIDEAFSIMPNHLDNHIQWLDIAICSHEDISGTCDKSSLYTFIGNKLSYIASLKDPHTHNKTKAFLFLASTTTHWARAFYDQKNPSAIKNYYPLAIYYHTQYLQLKDTYKTSYYSSCNAISVAYKLLWNSNKQIEDFNKMESYLKETIAGNEDGASHVQISTALWELADAYVAYDKFIPPSSDTIHSKRTTVALNAVIHYPNLDPITVEIDLPHYALATHYYHQKQYNDSILHLELAIKIAKQYSRDYASYNNALKTVRKTVNEYKSLSEGFLGDAACCILTMEKVNSSLDQNSRDEFSRNFKNILDIESRNSGFFPDILKVCCQYAQVTLSCIEYYNAKENHNLVKTICADFLKINKENIPPSLKAKESLKELITGISTIYRSVLSALVAAEKPAADPKTTGIVERGMFSETSATAPSVAASLSCSDLNSPARFLQF